MEADLSRENRTAMTPEKRDQLEQTFTEQIPEPDPSDWVTVSGTGISEFRCTRAAFAEIYEAKGLSIVPESEAGAAQPDS